MRKRKNPINASMEDLVRIGNEAFGRAADKASAAGQKVEYSDRTIEISEYLRRVLSKNS